MRYRINTPQVSSETIDGETIIIDFISGAYFSTDNLGATIWEALQSGFSREQLICAARLNYPCEDSSSEAVIDFIAELEKEKLMVPINEESTLPDDSPINFPETFTLPQLNKFTDMQDLLLLDPIHETDEQGWPVRKQ